MKIVVDMNLSPEWVPLLAREGWEARHWQEIGAGNAPDEEILDWAKKLGWVVLTQDLDFSDMLFATKAALPSVVTLRLKDELDEVVRLRVCAGLRQFEKELESGALLIVKPGRVRLRHLPLED